LSVAVTLFGVPATRPPVFGEPLTRLISPPNR
jgi:hypothetical protein